MTSSKPKVFPFYSRSRLSNFYICAFVIGDIRYNCSEQYYMAEKARYFGDEEMEKKILVSKKPHVHKAYGRKVRGFTEKAWKKRREGAMLEALRAKFTQDAYLREYLINTGDKILCEASPHDLVWGVGLRCNDPDVKDPKKWRGKNLLGKLLMQVRSELLAG